MLDGHRGVKNNDILLCFGEMKNVNFLRTGAYFFFTFELLGGFDPPWAQTKALC